MKTFALPLFLPSVLLVVAMGIQILPSALQAGELPPLQEIRSTSPAYDRYSEVWWETQRLKDARDVEGLEALAQKLRENREPSDDGTWLLSTFYEVMRILPEDPVQADLAMAFYREWARTSPQSITAQLCFAEALTNHAWDSSEETKEEQRIFSERLQEAWEVLEQAQKLEEKCPEWVFAAQGVALGQGWDRDRYMKMVEEALQKEPTYGRYYTRVCYYLMPRWHGRTGDFEAWIKQQADFFPLELRDRRYAWLVRSADSSAVEEEIVFGKDRLDWNRTRKGFQELLAETPDDLAVRFEYLRLALLAGDRETARQQFDITGGKYWPEAFDSKEKFERAREYAYGKGENPFAVKKIHSNRNKISAKTLALVNLIFRYVGGFLGGLIAGIFCLLLAIQHRQATAGVIALLVSAGLGAGGGTLCAIIAVIGLSFYLLSRPVEGLADGPRSLSPGRAFLWLLLVAGVDMVLQIFAAIPMGISLALSDIKGDVKTVTEHFYASGELFRYVLNASWMSLLLLLVVCRKRTVRGYGEMLGISLCSRKSLLLLIPSGAFLFLNGSGLNSFMDEKTREAMQEMALGVNSPVMFVLCLVLVVPLFEELLYRGFLFQAWSPKLGVVWASVGGSVLFTLSHFQYGWSGMVYILMFSLTLYALRWKTGSVLPSIFLHGMNNAWSCLFFYVETLK